MECLSGDTLDSLENCRMQAIIARTSDPTNAVICKECEQAEEGFSVTLTSEDTGKLSEGMYKIHFRLIGADGLSRRKLSGNLYVVQTAEGAE